jgi:IS5 family transposase
MGGPLNKEPRPASQDRRSLSRRLSKVYGAGETRAWARLRHIRLSRTSLCLAPVAMLLGLVSSIGFICSKARFFSLAM